MHTVFKTSEGELSARRFWATLWRHREQYVDWLKWHRDMKSRAETHREEPQFH